jgi:[protein-PII] uridylyltransferase
MSGSSAARKRSDRVDSLLGELAARLSGPLALVALGAYGRRELTPRSDAELLFLHAGQLTLAWVTEAVCYPLWEQAVRIEPSVRTLAECAADARRSWSAASRFLDARFIGGDRHLFDALDRQVLQPWRRDRERLRHRLRADTQRRHATHASAASSIVPDLVAGRGGLLDLAALRWLDDLESERSTQALDFLLETLSAAEEIAGHTPRHLTKRLQDRLSHSPGKPVLEDLYAHARWVAFNLDNALAPDRDDRQLGPVLALRSGQLVAERMPPVERAPALGLRVANLVGLAPPSPDLLAWASTPGGPIEWDAAALDQFWLLLRAADWRAWDFLDVTGLLIRYLPELEAIWRKDAPPGAGDLALDSHSFLALRSLHDWTEKRDPLVERAWRSLLLRHRDWLYLAVLLHELSPDAAALTAAHMGLSDEARAGVAFAVTNFRLVADTAARRDLNDEDLLLELATRIRTRQRLSSTFLVAIAHELACGPAVWTPWKADLVRQLFGRLELAVRQSGEVGLRRTRSLEHHRERIARELQKRGMQALLPLVSGLPRRYVLTRTPALVARHLALLEGTPLRDGDVRMRADRLRQPGLWEVLIVARDRPGLLATVAGVMALRGASVLAADAATCSDGLVLDVFTVQLDAPHWPDVGADLRAALQGLIPVHDLLGPRRLEPGEADAIQVVVDNTASQFFNVVEVRAPDQVGLLYRIASALHDLGLDIHHARIATHPEGALDVFYARDLSGEKLSDSAANAAAERLTAVLRGATHEMES